MNIRQYQGWALIVSAALLLLPIGTYLQRGPVYLYAFWWIIAGAIFIFGLPSIYFAQPQIGQWGKFGLILMAIPPFVEACRGLASFAYDLWDVTILFLWILILPSYLWDIFPPLFLAFYLGYVIVGWLTIRVLIFPKWTGWLFIVFGALIMGLIITRFLLPIGSLTVAYAVVRSIGAAALGGYGWHVLRYHTAEKNEYSPSQSNRSETEQDNTPIYPDENAVSPSRDHASQKRYNNGGMMVGGLVLFFIMISFVFSNMPSDVFPEHVPTATPTVTSTPTPRPVMTATLQTWNTSAVPPSLASAEEAKDFIDKRGFFNAVWNSSFSVYTTKFPDVQSPYQPGDVILYEVSLSRSTPVIWVHEECAPTNEYLEDIFANLQLDFVLNDAPVSLDYFAITEHKFIDDSPCRAYVALINDWTPGQHLVETHVTYKKDIQNDTRTESAGTRIYIHVVTATP